MPTAQELIDYWKLNEERKRKLLESVIFRANKRNTKSSENNKSYYKEKYAIRIKKALDGMMIDLESRIFKFENYPHMKKDTVYQMITQGKEFLLDKMDLDGKYVRFIRYTRIDRSMSKEGIVILYHPDPADDMTLPEPELFKAPEDPLTGERLPPPQHHQEIITKYLESDVYTPLTISKLKLSEEEVANINFQLGGLNNIDFVVHRHQIKIIKHKPKYKDERLPS